MTHCPVSLHHVSYLVSAPVTAPPTTTSKPLTHTHDPVKGGVTALDKYFPRFIKMALTDVFTVTVNEVTTCNNRRKEVQLEINRENVVPQKG